MTKKQKERNMLLVDDLKTAMKFNDDLKKRFPTIAKGFEALAKGDGK